MVFLDGVTTACEMRPESTEDVSSGTGSSLFDEAFSSGRKGLYGAGCWMRADVSAGMSKRVSAVRTRLFDCTKTLYRQ